MLHNVSLERLFYVYFDSKPDYSRVEQPKGEKAQSSESKGPTGVLV